MIPNPDTLARIREQAEAYAAKRSDPLTELRTEIRRAYLAGADAGYLARIAEERK